MPALTRSRSSPMLLAYHAPFDWPALLAYFAARATPGVELVEGGQYWRTARIDGHSGVIRVAQAPARQALGVWHTTSLAPVRSRLRPLLRRMFDLDTDPGPIAEHLGRDARLEGLVRRHPGLRVPGSLSGFEIAVRAILGQQVSVRGATTLAGRLAATVGERFRLPDDAAPRVRDLPLTHIAPSPERMAAAGVERIAAIGLPRARAETLVHLARAVVEGRTGELAPGPSADGVLEQLLELPGIGPWTAQYVALRALRVADAFPEADLGLRRAVGDVSVAELRRAAERWRPWRGYAAMYLWTTTARRRT